MHPPATVDPLPATGEADRLVLRGWEVEGWTALDSTHRAASGRSAWQAVWAAEQTEGRGTHDRTFTSDPGGLYMTAVLPAPGGGRPWLGFSLAVGWALRGLLRRQGLASARLRWPNDLMVGARKLGGILVDQDGPETLLVGVGINVRNRPWRTDPSLSATATRLADHLARVPEPSLLLGPVLDALRVAHHEFARHGLAGLHERINLCWGECGRVEVDFGERQQEGRFAGIDRAGHLLVWTSETRLQSFAPHRIHRLRELPEPGGDSFSSRPA